VAEGIDPSLADEMVDKFTEGGLLVVRAGGRGGLMSAVIGGWSAQRKKDEVQTVTREIGS
jgi:predicted Rossmann-fold nucleotide-binding protein